VKRIEMSKEDELSAVLGLIYESLLDDSLWPKTLVKLADAMEAAQVGLLSLDRMARTYNSLAPRTDPVMDTKFKTYWAFHNPLWPRTITRPIGEVFLLESLVPRNNLITTDFFHEWFQPAGFGIAAIGANLVVTDEVSSMITVGNAPWKDHITDEQMRMFRAVVPHVNRAVLIHRKFRLRDLNQNIAPERLEHISSGVILVDRAAKVLFANAHARALMCSDNGLTLQAGHLQTTDGSNELQGLITTCAAKTQVPNDVGGEIVICRDQRCALRVRVTPLRANGTIAELPWLGLQLPVAILTISNAASNFRSGKCKLAGSQSVTR
jgi:hypothetical protein